jgi:hypothetical protein
VGGEPKGKGLTWKGDGIIGEVGGGHGRVAIEANGVANGSSVRGKSKMGAGSLGRLGVGHACFGVAGWEGLSRYFGLIQTLR